VLTGAGSGIESAFARELAACSGRVMCSDINLEQAKATTGLIEQAGGCARAMACAVTTLADVEALVEALVEVAEVWLGGPAEVWSSKTPAGTPSAT